MLFCIVYFLLKVDRDVSNSDGVKMSSTKLMQPLEKKKGNKIDNKHDYSMTSQSSWVDLKPCHHHVHNLL